MAGQRKIVHNNSSAGEMTKTNHLAWPHRVGIGENRMLVVGIVIEASTMLNMNINSVQYGSADMLYISDSAIFTELEDVLYKTMLFYLPNPASGTQRITISTTGICRRISAGAVSLENVHQGMPESQAANVRSRDHGDEVTGYIHTFSENAWIVDVVAFPSTSGQLTSATTETKEVEVAGRHVLARKISLEGYSIMSCAAFAPAVDSPTINMVYDHKSKLQRFAVARLERSLLRRARQTSGMCIEDISIRVGKSDSTKEEGFVISQEGKSVTISAVDQRGAMYGILELSERIMAGDFLELQTEIVSPSFAFRALKHNTPWSSYRQDFALDQHTDTVMDLAYWESYLNMMAENRFNTLTIWTQHPFPYMIRPKNFPQATPFTDQELEGWRSLYQGIFRLAKERGIEIYMINWNIFVSEAFRQNYDPNAHTDEMLYIGEAYTTDLIEQYTRECVTQVLEEYPDLTGFGFTLGESMGGMTPQEREQWISRTIIAGLQVANRPAKLIYRMPLSANLGSGGSTSEHTEQVSRQSMETLEDIILPIETELKYNWSRGYSNAKLLQVHGGKISTTYWDPAPENYRINWMVRNEDFFTLRWGQVDFIRALLAESDRDYVGGYYIGSECYIPALNYFDRDKPEDNRINYGFQRQWFFYLAWGRLLYDQASSDRVFEQAFEQKYGRGEDLGKRLLAAYKLASDFPTLFGSLLHNTWDFTAYAEGFLCPRPGVPVDLESPFLSLERLIHYPVFDERYLSIKGYVQAVAQGQKISEEKITPLQLADQLEQAAEQALSLVDGLQSENPSLQEEIGDIKAWSYLSRYFAIKLRAGCAFAGYTMTKDVEQKTKALTLIQSAKQHWGDLVFVTKPRYKPASLIHIADDFTWENLSDDVDRDIHMVENA